jgi:Icc-related predicted phosphoesterase
MSWWNSLAFLEDFLPESQSLKSINFVQSLDRIASMHDNILSDLDICQQIDHDFSFHSTKVSNRFVTSDFQYLCWNCEAHLRSVEHAYGAYLRIRKKYLIHNLEEQLFALLFSHSSSIGSTGGCEVRILGFSDFHNKASSIRQASRIVSVEHPDVIVVSGDLANADMRGAKYILEELSRYSSPVLFVPGNMDHPALANWKDDDRVICLHGKRMFLSGVWFIGLGGAITSHFVTPFEFDEVEARRILTCAIQPNLNPVILVSHCPPRDTELDLAFGRWHVGSKAVRSFVEENSPALVICGHIHEARGIDQIGTTSIVNVGVTAHGDYASISFSDSLKIELRRF